MPSTITAATPLTASDLLALRTCGSVSFHGWKGGEFVIRPSIEAADYKGVPKILTVAQQNAFNQIEDTNRRRTITVHGYISGYHGEMSQWSGDGESTAFTMIHSAQFDTNWRTTAQMLRAGDLLSLRFMGGNNNGYLKEAGLNLDTCHLFVERPTKGEPQRFAFHVDTTVAPDNSARMVKRYGS